MSKKVKVVSFSGGRTSAYLAWLMEKTKQVGEVIVYLFMDTGAEHPKTYDFVRSVAKNFGVDIVCLRVDITPELGKANGYKVIPIDEIGHDLKPWADMIKKYGVPYFGGAFCTDRMKLGPFTKYCNDNFGKGNYETWLGIRADEPSRLWGASGFKSLRDEGMPPDEISQLWADVRNGIHDGSCVSTGAPLPTPALDRVENCDSNGMHFLAEISDFDKQDVLGWWERQDFDLGIDEWLGNCVFCMKKSELKLAAAKRDEPGLYIDFIECITSSDVRTGLKAGSVASMYRKKRSLQQVISMFDGSTGDEIKSRIRGGKMVDSGSCSESCEVFACGIQLEIDL